MPPLPDIFRSRFLRQRLSRFFNQAAMMRTFVSRFMKGAAAMIPPMPDVFSSRFYSKPRPPDKNLKQHWPPGKPRGPGR
jgi:hypothetical protein